MGILGVTKYMYILYIRKRVHVHCTCRENSGSLLLLLIRVPVRVRTVRVMEVDGRTDGVILKAEFVLHRVYTYIRMSCTSIYSAMRTLTLRKS